MSLLFEPLVLAGLTLRNRIAVPPMCQYSAQEGHATDWHLVHYGGLAQGGASLVIVEATAVVPEGRISPLDLGLWEDSQVEGLARVAAFMESQGAVPAIQLAHAGRKACTAPAWEGRVGTIPASEGGWEPVGPSALAFDAHHAVPRVLEAEALPGIVEAFRASAIRALAAGFKAVEIHGAHGYLLHQFLSPHTNTRTDGWGGDFAGRTRLLKEVVGAVRSVWPVDLPLLVRLSATDWAEGGWDVDQTVALCRDLKDLGVDLIDVSSGGLLPGVSIPVAPGYQVAFASRIRREAGLPTGAVGLITEARQAEQVLAAGDADLVLVGRELLRHPRWPLAAAAELGVAGPCPRQYARATR